MLYKFDRPYLYYSENNFIELTQYRKFNRVSIGSVLSRLPWAARSSYPYKKYQWVGYV